MKADAKISSAFGAFLRDSGPHDKHDAIVIYRQPPLEERPFRGRMRELKKRLDAVRLAQQPVAEKVLRTYERTRPKSDREPGPFATSPIGGHTLPVAWAEVTRASLPALAEQDDVVAVIPNQKVHLIEPKRVGYEDLAKSETKSGFTWGLQQLEVSDIWPTTQGQSINVAVIDTGVYGDHPALKGRVKQFVVIDPVGQRVEASPSFDAGQHGTHVCGTIAGAKAHDEVAIGVAPGVNLLVAAALLGRATLRSILAGIAWAIEQGADIINMSLGLSYYEPKFVEVFRILEGYGILPVVAVGNENHGNSSAPGNASNALSVGAVEKVLGGKLSVPPFSSGASLVFPGEENALVTKPDVVAPGVQVYSCIPPEQTQEGTFEYTYMDGTSMASPHVAGVAALLMAAKPEAPAADIIEVLKNTAHHPNGESRRPDNRWGYGMIRPKEALQALR